LPAKAGSKNINAAIQNPAQIKKFFASVMPVFIGFSTNLRLTLIGMQAASQQTSVLSFNGLRELND
jgi:hypothetical protein